MGRDSNYTLKKPSETQRLPAEVSDYGGGVKLGFTVSLMLSDEAASVWVFGVAAPDLSPSFNPTYRMAFSKAGRISIAPDWAREPRPYGDHSSRG